MVLRPLLMVSSKSVSSNALRGYNMLELSMLEFGRTHLRTSNGRLRRGSAGNNRDNSFHVRFWLDFEMCEMHCRYGYMSSGRSALAFSFGQACVVNGLTCL